MDPATRYLLIGIGNRLRGDDGAGYRLAEWLQAEGDLAATPWQVLTVQQLTPELAPTIAACDAVLFVDAWLQSSWRPAEPVLEPINAARQPSPWPGGLSHQCSPAQLLALCDALYDQRPHAWRLLLPARQLEHGELLSGTTARALTAGVQLLRRWRPGDA